VTKPYNVILAGIGGQGVVALTRVFREASKSLGWSFQSSIFKGGAQRLGAVHSTLRIFREPTPDYRHYSPEIPTAGLDLMIGFEPREALRYQSFFSPGTVFVINVAKQGELGGRSLVENGNLLNEPVKLLHGLGCTVASRDFTAHAKKLYDDPKMMNFELGLACCESLGISRDLFIQTFVQVIPNSKNKLSKNEDPNGR